MRSQQSRQQTLPYGGGTWSQQSRSGGPPSEVISDRVFKLTHKINELHHCIEKGKLEKIEEWEKRVGSVERNYKEAYSNIEDSVQTLETKVDSIHSFITDR